MTEENQTPEYPLAEKQAMAAGVPFKVLRKEPRGSWRSNYAYYLKQRKEGGSLRPLFGRKLEDDTFQVYINGSWVTKDFWNDYSEDKVDTDGKVIMAPSGKPRKQVFFDEKFDWLLEFESPINIEYWSKEQSARVTEQHEITWVRTSKSLSGKIQEQTDDPRVDLDSNYFLIDYDPTKSPAEQYKVKFDH